MASPKHESLQIPLRHRPLSGPLGSGLRPLCATKDIYALGCFRTSSEAAELEREACDPAAKAVGPTARPSHSWGRHWRPGHPVLPTRCLSQRRARARHACRAGSALSWRLRELPERRWQQCACHPQIAVPAGEPKITVLLVAIDSTRICPSLKICAAALVTISTSSAHTESCIDQSGARSRGLARQTVPCSALQTCSQG